MSFKGLWVDDVIAMPDVLAKKKWTQARTAHEALLKLELLEFDELDINIKLTSHYGSHDITGRDIIQWLYERKEQGLTVPRKITIHSIPKL